MTLSGPERSVLVVLRASEALPIDEEEVASRAGLPIDQVRGSLQRLRAKHLVVLEEEHESTVRPTPRGEAALQKGLPERRFLSALERRGGTLTPEAAAAEGLDDEERSAAIGILRRRGYLEDGIPFRLRGGAGSGDLAASRRDRPETGLERGGGRRRGDRLGPRTARPRSDRASVDQALGPLRRGPTSGPGHGRRGTTRSGHPRSTRLGRVARTGVPPVRRARRGPVPHRGTTEPLPRVVGGVRGDPDRPRV